MCFKRWLCGFEKGFCTRLLTEWIQGDLESHPLSSLTQSHCVKKVSVALTRQSKLLYALPRLLDVQTHSKHRQRLEHLQHYDVWRTVQIHTENKCSTMWFFKSQEERKKKETVLTQLNVGLRLTPLLAVYLSLLLAPLIIPRQWSQQDQPFLLNTWRKHSRRTKVDKGVY